MDESKGGICRVCLAESRNKSLSIYEKYKDSCISDYITALTNVTICANDGLPDRICSSCLEELEQAVQFKQKCESSHHILTSAPVIKTEDEIDIKDITVKEEEPEIQFSEPDLYEDQYDDDEDNNKDLIVDIKSEDVKSRAIDLHLQCDDCKEFFKSKCKLRVHWKKVHLLEALKCSDCKRMFKSLKAFNVHKKNKTLSCKYATKCKIEGEGKRRVFHCKDCSYNSRRMKDLITHLVIHTGDRPFKCDICVKAFTQQSSLRSHQESAHPELRIDIPCHVCGKIVKGRSKMYRHMRVHSEGKWPCPICFKKFKTKCCFKTHMNRHSGVKSYTCELCAQTFVATSELSNHKRYVHEKRFNIYKCDICGYSSKKVTIILKHKAKHNDNNIPCTVCGMFFESKHKLVRHQKKHVQEKLFECTFCAKKFRRNDNLRTHIKNVHKCKVPEIIDYVKNKPVMDSKEGINKDYLSEDSL